MLGLCKMVKTRGWERLQGQLSDDQPDQDKLRCPCCHRKIWRKEPKQTIHFYAVSEVDEASLHKA